jgi:hypothetical protein
MGAPQRGARVGRTVQPDRRIRPWIAQPAVTLLARPESADGGDGEREIPGSGRLLGLQPIRAESRVPASEGVLPLLIEHRVRIYSSGSIAADALHTGSSPSVVSSRSFYSPNRKTGRWGYPRGGSGAGRRAG